MVNIPVVTQAAQEPSQEDQANTGLLEKDETASSERTTLTSSSVQIPESEAPSTESGTQPSEISTSASEDSFDKNQSSESQTAESTSTSESEKNSTNDQKTVKSARAVTEVSVWADFVNALKNTDVTAIKVTGDLTAPTIGSLPTVTRTVDIDFDSHKLDLKGMTLTINTPGKVIMHNLHFTGLIKSFLASGTGTLELADNISSVDGNAAGIAYMPKGSVVLNGVTLNYDRVTDSSTGRYNPAITGQNLTITNHATVTSEAQNFYATDISTESKVIIDGGSSVTTNSNKSVNTDYGTIWEIKSKSEFWIKDSSMLAMTGNARGDKGPFAIAGIGTTLNVTGSSQLKVTAENTSAVYLQNDSEEFNVEDHSVLDLVSNGDNDANQGTVRFRSGQMAFNVKTESKVNITKNSINGTAQFAPGVRTFGDNNKINISGGSDFDVHRAVGSIVSDPGDNGKNAAISLGGGTGNEFNLMDKKSSVVLDAKSGPAVDGGTGGKTTITAGAGTYFIARGMTKSADKGIFGSTELHFSMDDVDYFDFRNNRPGGGMVMNVPNYYDESKFSGKNSDLSVWKAGSDLDGDPAHQWFNVNFALSGLDFGVLDSTDNTQMQSEFGSLTNYSRMSANNQSALLDEIRVPTNADKFIYAHASVPEGKDEIRDAYTGEVQATIGVYDETGKEVAQVKGESIGEPLSIYGDPERKGIIKIDAPNKEFLKTGYTLKVLDAWRGMNDSDWIHQSSPEELTKDTPKVYDVTPADPVKLTNNQETVPPSAKEVSGTGEAGDILEVFLNNQNTNIETTVNENGEFTAALPTGLQKGDTLQLFLKDHAGAANVTNPPSTNDSIGNIEPSTDVVYHDAKFLAAKKLTVNGSLELVSVPDSLDFGTQEIDTKAKTYYPTISGKLEVSDTRGTDKAPWELLLKEEVGLHSDTTDLSGLLKYKNKQASVQVNQENQVVETGNLTEDGSIVISNQWTQGEGLSLTVPVGKQILGQYTGKLSWTLENVPENS